MPTAGRAQWMRRMASSLIAAVFILVTLHTATAQAPSAPRFHVLAIAEAGGIHKPFVDAAKVWLAQEASP